MRTLALAFLAITASATTGCDTFSDQATVHSVTHTDFDDRFHDGLAEVWNTCTEPLDLTPGLTSISMLDGCGVQAAQQHCRQCQQRVSWRQLSEATRHQW